jgi:hypothetical protein
MSARRLGCSPLGTYARWPLISLMKYTNSAPARNVAALKYSASVTDEFAKTSMCRASTLVTRASSENRPAPRTGVSPYVVIRLSWLAGSIWSRRTRLGTDASFAGIQNRLTHSIRKLAT